MIKLENIQIQYENTIIQHNLNLCFPSKGFIGIVGKSGCGKTSLMRIIAGVNDNYTGEIYYNDQNKKTMDMAAFRNANITYLSQDNNGFEENTVLDNIRLSVPSDADIAGYASRYRLESLMKQKMKSLSLGERQRVLLVIALSKRSKINLLDEALCNLDEETKALALQDIKALSRDSLVILISHERKDIQDCCDAIMDLDKEKEFSYASELTAFDIEPKPAGIALHRIRLSGHLVLRTIYSLLLALFTALAFCSLNLAGISFEEDYISGKIREDSMGIGFRLVDYAAVADNFANVEIPYINYDILYEYYKENPDFSLSRAGTAQNERRFLNIVILDEITLNQQKIVLGAEDIILPDTMKNLYGYYEDGTVAPSMSVQSEIVHFSPGNIFRFNRMNAQNLAFTIRDTYSREELYHNLKLYFAQEEAERMSEVIIMSRSAYTRFMLRAVGIQLKDENGTVFTFYPYDKNISTSYNPSVPEALQDTEVYYFRGWKNNVEISAASEFFGDSSEITLNLTYKENTLQKTYRLTSTNHAVVYFKLITDNRLEESSVSSAELFLSEQAMLEIMNTLDYDYDEMLKPCNLIVDLQAHIEELAESVAKNHPLYVFSSLQDIYSMTTFKSMKSTYIIISVCLVAAVGIGYAGFLIFYHRQCRDSIQVMKNKMMMSKEILRFERGKVGFSFLILGIIGMMIGFIVCLTAVSLKLSPFYSLEWLPFTVLGLYLLVFTGGYGLIVYKMRDVID